MARKYYPYVFTFLVVFPMCLVMSLGATLFNFGITAFFWEQWLRGLTFGFIVGYPTALIIVPVARKVIDKMNWR